ncbi:MAG: transcriptional regulator, LysR family [Nocardioides sp.]|nr:transcriptional regulator, LysR family [Nocardioides sp.]
MDVRGLRYFLAVADARSFTQAARHLHVSQPALSQSVRRLERHLASDLFVRDRRNPASGLRLTPSGQVLYEEATDILAAVARAERRVRRTAHGVDKSSVAIGFASSTPRELVTTAMTLGASLPRVDALPVHVTWGDEHTFLRDGRVDLTFLQYPRDAPLPEYTVQTLTRVSRVVIVRADHRLAELAEVTLRDLATEPVLDPGYANVPEMHRDFWLGEPRPLEGPGPHVVPLEVRTVEEMCACVAAGKGLAITSATVAGSYARPDLVFLPVTDLEPVDVGIARLRDEHRREVLETFEAIAAPARAQT